MVLSFVELSVIREYWAMVGVDECFDYCLFAGCCCYSEDCKMVEHMVFEM